jgi:hypothetical protein
LGLYVTRQNAKFNDWILEEYSGRPVKIERKACFHPSSQDLFEGASIWESTRLCQGVAGYFR